MSVWDFILRYLFPPAALGIFGALIGFMKLLYGQNLKQHEQNQSRMEKIEKSIERNDEDNVKRITLLEEGVTTIKTALTGISGDNGIIGEIKGLRNRMHAAEGDIAALDMTQGIMMAKLDMPRQPRSR